MVYFRQVTFSQLVDYSLRESTPLKTIHLAHTLQLHLKTMHQSFIIHIQKTIQWLDEEAHTLSREDLQDSVRARMVELAQRFVAYPHCENFALMPEES